MYYFYCPQCGNERTVKILPSGTIPNPRDGYGRPIHRFVCSRCYNLDAGFMRQDSEDMAEKVYYRSVIGLYQRKENVKMTDREFALLVMQVLTNYLKDNYSKKIVLEDIFVIRVWGDFQNKKALVSVCMLKNSLLEITYNAEEKKMYMDVYGIQTDERKEIANNIPR